MSKKDAPSGFVHCIYIAILTTDRLALRGEIKGFFNYASHKVTYFSECAMQDEATQAVLVAATYLLIKPFEELIGIGLPRCAPTIINSGEEVRLKARPQEYEQIPLWAQKVLPLVESVWIPDKNNKGARDERELGGQLKPKKSMAQMLAVCLII